MDELHSLIVWFKKQGYKIHCTDNSYWVEVAPKIYQAIPYHFLIQPSEQELNRLIKETGAIALRYSTQISQAVGKISYHVIYDRKEMPLQDLHKKVRHDVKHGLEFASIEPISFERLAEEGWCLRSDTLERQGREGAEGREWWRRLCLSAEGLPGFEAWGAIHDGELVAAIIAFTIGDTCSILYQQSCTQFLKYGINNALTYVFVNESLGRNHINKIFYGLHSLDAPASVDNYKFRMGFTALPVRQRVIFNPLFIPFVNRISYQITQGIVSKFPNLPKLHKFEGMLRFYLQGCQPLSEQEWPENLVEQKSELMLRFARSGHKLSSSTSNSYSSD